MQGVWSGGGVPQMPLAQTHFLMFSGRGSFWCGAFLWESREHHFREVAKLALSSLPESKIGEIHCQRVTAGNLALDIHKTPSPSGISQIKWEYWVFSASLVWNWSWAGFAPSGGCIKSTIVGFSSSFHQIPISWKGVGGSWHIQSVCWRLIGKSLGYPINMPQTFSS